MKKKKIVAVEIEKVIKLSDGSTHTIYKVASPKVQDSTSFTKGGIKND